MCGKERGLLKLGWVFSICRDLDAKNPFSCGQPPWQPWQSMLQLQTLGGAMCAVRLAMVTMAAANSWDMVERHGPASRSLRAAEVALDIRVSDASGLNAFLSCSHVA